jgi:leukotriene-A4 hydrolase
MVKKYFSILGLALIASCGSTDEQSTYVSANAAHMADDRDYHTLSNADSVAITHLDLDIAVDFEKKQIVGSARWDIQQKYPSSEIIFDTEDLSIDSVIRDDGIKVEYTLGELDKELGRALHVPIVPTTKSLTVYYRTGNATALQWLSPQQTFGKKKPFLYTQSESIYARSWIPCQDGPGIRFTYNAQVKVPTGLLALMSAENPQKLSSDGIYNFKMDKPIPAYLMALAVGDIGFKAIDNRAGVYAEHPMLEKAHAEFEDIGAMIGIAEKLYGPYRWGRYDVLVLPPGFPIGGMENPKLTFSTPTIISGDKSLVNLIAHELAHNWSGNLVTNKTWNDFWLNEGFTVYFERRITEAMQGKSYVDMLWELSQQDIAASMKVLPERDTWLRLDLKGRHPELGLTDIAYEKGAHFLWLIERTVGREKFDVFLRNYFDEHAFQTMSTQRFLQYLDEKLLKGHDDWKKAIDVDAWVFGAGLPANCPKPERERFAKVDETLKKFEEGMAASELPADKWSTYEWLHFLRNLKAPVAHDRLADLDKNFTLTQSKNSEIADVWFVQAVKSGYEPAYPAMRAFLNVTGRQKFLEPLYNAMLESGNKSMAEEIFEKSKNNYHPLAQKNIEGLIKGENKYE